MAMLDREKFFERIKERLGEDDSDEALSFLEDVTDTYDDLERRPPAVRSCRSHSSVLLPYCGLFKGLILWVVSLPCNGSCLMCSICSRLPSRFPML